MATKTARKSDPSASSKDQAAMKKFGITRTQVDYFHFGEYKYTNLRDALAQANRPAEKV